MALMPKRVKYRKSQRGKIKGECSRGNTIVFGDYGLMALDQHWLSARQLEAGRIACSHYLGGMGKMWRRVFPWKPISSKPLEVRMGKGKGETDFWAAVIRPGAVLFEVGGVSEEIAREAMARMSHKFPFKCKFIKRRPKV
ncbi:50S ribosomal protein L16 [Planctomycetota bacterium]